jgi:hypothetical protein
MTTATTPTSIDNLASINPSRLGETLSVHASVVSISHREGKNSRGYYDLVLADSTARFSAKIWGDSHAYTHGTAAEIVDGMIVRVMFTADVFRDAIQLNVLRIREAEDAECNLDIIRGEGWEQVEGLHRKTLVFDIETVPDVNRIGVPSDVAMADHYGVSARHLPHVPQSIVDAIAKSANRGLKESNAEPDFGKAMSLSPYFGKVVSLAFCEGDDEDDVVNALIVPRVGGGDTSPAWARPMTEPELLRSFWHLASAADQVVSFNGHWFDVPFLVVRSLIHGIPVRVDLLSSPYSLRPHLDIFRLLGNGQRGPATASLDVVCWALGIPSPKGEMDGSGVASAYAAGRIDSIAEYNAADVRATAALYRKMKHNILAFRSE